MNGLTTTIVELASGSQLPFPIASIGTGHYAFVAAGIALLGISIWLGLRATGPAANIITSVAIFGSTVVAVTALVMLVASSPVVAADSPQAVDDDGIVTEPYCAWNARECFAIQHALDIVQPFDIPEAVQDKLTGEAATGEPIVEYDCDSDGRIDAGGPESELSEQPCSGDAR